MEKRRKGFINRKYKGKIFAGLAAIVIAASGFTLSSCGEEKIIVPPVIEDIQDQDNEIEIVEMAIDEVNDYEAIETRIISFIENAGLHGLGELDVEDVLALYIILNIEDISPSQAAYLYDDRFNAEILMDKATQMINTIASDVLYSTPGNMIDAGLLIVDEESKVELIKIQELIARYNGASENERLDIAGILLNEIEELYATDKWKKIPDGVSLLIQSKIWFVYHDLLNDSAVKARYGNKMEALELIMFANVTNCIENAEARYNENIASRYSDNSIKLLKKLIMKYEAMKEYAINHSITSRVRELIASVIDKANIVFVARKSIYETQLEKKAPLMQETVTVTPAPTSPTGQTPITKQEIDQTNRDAELRAKGMKDGYEAGNRDAIADTTDASKLSSSNPFPSRNPNGYASTYANDRAYTQAYSDEYLKSYVETILDQAPVLGKYHGMNYGIRLVEQGKSYDTIDSIFEPKFTKFNGTIFQNSYIGAFNRASRVSYDEFKAMMDQAQKEQGGNVSGPTVIEKSPTESVIINPGFTVDANGYVWDSNGNPVYDENGNHMRQVGNQSSQNNYQPAQTEPAPSYSQPQDTYNEQTDTTVYMPDTGGEVLYDEYGNVIQLQSQKIK